MQKPARLEEYTPYVQPPAARLGHIFPYGITLSICTFMKPFPLLISFLLLFGSACERLDIPLDPTLPFTHRYLETQCADPWADRYTGSRDETSEAAMRAFLADAGIGVRNSQKVYADSLGLVCAACTCPSGAAFEVAVRPQDVADLEALGFTPIDP